MREKIGRILRTDFMSLLSHTKNYLASHLFYVFLNLLSIPVFSRLYTTEEYGILSVYQSYSVILAIFLSLNVYRSVTRYYFEDRGDFDEFMGTLLILCFSIYGIGLLIFYLTLPLTGEVIGLGRILPLLFTFSGVNFIAEGIYSQILKAKKLSALYSKLRITNNTMTILISIVAVYLLKDDRYYGQIVTTIVIGMGFSLYYYSQLRSVISFRIRGDHVRYILKYSLPLLPFTLSTIVLNRFDQIIIQGILGPSEVGVYAMGYNIGNLILMVTTSVETSLVPEFYRLEKEKRFDQLDKLVRRSMKIVLMGCTALIFGTRDVFQILVDQKFSRGVDIVLPVVVANVFMGIFLMHRIYLDYHKYNGKLSFISISAGVINIVSNLILIPSMGILGAAYSTLISFIYLALASKIALLLTSDIPVFRMAPFLADLVIFLGTLVLFFTFKMDQLGFTPSGLFFRAILYVVFVVVLFGNEIYPVLRGYISR